MAENGNSAAPAQPQMKILGQYVRDLSFENVMAQKGGVADAQPDVNVQVNLDARKRPADNQYEVIVKLTINSRVKDSEDVLFVLELDLAGVFHIENVPDEQMHPFLLIECPRMLFPYLRRIVGDVTRDGGLPPLNLENIAFLNIYRSELARRQAEAAEAEASGEAPTEN